MTILTNWRDHLQVHPAAEMFPLLSETDPAALKELAEDIRQHGQREPASYIKNSDGNRLLLDGRNRLDALEMLGRKIDINDSRMFEQLSGSIDAQAFIISKNIHRRHLTPEKKRDLIGLLLKANPEKSDRQIATVTKADHKTVGAIRADLEGRGEIPHVEARTDTKGREQPVKKPAMKQEPEHREKIRRAEAITRKHAAEMRKRREDCHEYMDEKISRFACKLIQLDARLARELWEIIAEGGDPHQLMDDLQTGIATNNNNDGLDIPDNLKRAAP
jgi:ParB-like chromosome segregation protein Spo0J